MRGENLIKRSVSLNRPSEGHFDVYALPEFYLNEIINKRENFRAEENEAFIKFYIMS